MLIIIDQVTKSSFKTLLFVLVLSPPSNFCVSIFIFIAARNETWGFTQCQAKCISTELALASFLWVESMIYNIPIR